MTKLNSRRQNIILPALTGMLLCLPLWIIVFVSGEPVSKSIFSAIVPFSSVPFIAFLVLRATKNRERIVKREFSIPIVAYLVLVVSHLAMTDFRLEQAFIFVLGFFLFCAVLLACGLLVSRKSGLFAVLCVVIVQIVFLYAHVLPIRLSSSSFFNRFIFTISWTRFSEYGLRGLLSVNGTVFLVLVLALFLFLLNHRNSSRKAKNIALGLLVIPIFIAFLPPLELDFTKNRKWTSSDFTKEILSGLSSEVRVSWYRNQDLLKTDPSAWFIGDRLASLSRENPRFISVREIDPLNMGIEANIQRIGIMPTVVSGETSGKSLSLYSGLLIEYRGDYEVIPFTVDSITLEYDITLRLLALLSRTDNRYSQWKSAPIVILDATLSENDFYAYAEEWLSYAGFSLEKREPTPEAIPELSVPVIILGSERITEDTAHAISAFINSGGKVLIFMSSNTVAVNGNWQAKGKTAFPLDAVIGELGIIQPRRLLLDTFSHNLELRTSSDSVANASQSVDYPYWIEARAEPSNGSAASLLLSGIEKVHFFWTSGFELSNPTELKLFLSTSPQAVAVNEPYDTNPFSNTKKIISSSGVSNAFPLAIFTESPGRMILIADELMPSNMIDFTGNEDNVRFLVNCAEWLSNRDRLLALKEIAQFTNFPILLTPRSQNVFILISVLTMIGAILLMARIPINMKGSQK